MFFVVPVKQEPISSAAPRGNPPRIVASQAEHRATAEKVAPLLNNARRVKENDEKNEEGRRIVYLVGELHERADEPNAGVSLFPQS